MELFWSMLVGSAGRSGEMAVQGRGKTEEKPYEARRSSSPSSRTATGVGIGGRVAVGCKMNGYPSIEVTIC